MANCCDARKFCVKSNTLDFLKRSVFKIEHLRVSKAGHQRCQCGSVGGPRSAVGGTGEQAVFLAHKIKLSIAYSTVEGCQQLRWWRMYSWGDDPYVLVNQMMTTVDQRIMRIVQ